MLCTGIHHSDWPTRSTAANYNVPQTNSQPATQQPLGIWSWIFYRPDILIIGCMAAMATTLFNGKSQFLATHKINTPKQQTDI